MKDKEKYSPGWLDSFNPPIPEVYGDAITYLEQIKNLYNYVKEKFKQLSERLKWLELNIDEIAKEAGEKAALEQLEYINSELQKISEKISYFNTINLTDHNQMRNEYTSEFGRAVSLAYQSLGKVEEIEAGIDEKVNSSVQNYYAPFRMEINRLDRSMSLLDQSFVVLGRRFDRLNTEYLEFKDHIFSLFYQQIDKMEKEIDEKISLTNADNLIVTSAVTGKPVTLNKALQELLGQTNVLPLKCGDFDKMMITTHKFDNRKFTARMFDSYAYLLFYKELTFPDFYSIIKSEVEKLQEQIDTINNTKWFSIISERFTSPLTAYNELATYVLSQHSNRMTSGDFDNLQLTVNSFDKRKILVSLFDWSSANISWK